MSRTSEVLMETPDWEVFSGGGGDQERVGRDGDRERAGDRESWFV